MICISLLKKWYNLKYWKKSTILFIFFGISLTRVISLKNSQQILLLSIDAQTSFVASIHEQIQQSFWTFV